MSAEEKRASNSSFGKLCKFAGIISDREFWRREKDANSILSLLPLSTRISSGAMQGERVTGRSLDQTTTTAEFYDNFIDKVSTSPPWPAPSEQVSSSLRCSDSNQVG